MTKTVVVPLGWDTLMQRTGNIGGGGPENVSVC